MGGYGVNGKKGGDSKISLILDSCIILEEWTSAGCNRDYDMQVKVLIRGMGSRQWQQTWVDNTGNTTAFTKGKFENNKIVFILIHSFFKRHNSNSSA